MSITARVLKTALLAVLTQLSLTAETAARLPTGSEPRFLLQAIEVRGARDVSTAVVVSESLLEEGQVYTESELRRAVRRIRRLPFILEVDFALGKGRERGAYVLLVEVREAKRFFYEVDLEQGFFGEPLALEETDPLDENLASSLTAGARLFLGRYNLLFAAAGSEGARLGWTRYNLFDRGVVLSLGYAAEICCATALHAIGLDPTYSSWIDEEGSESFSLSLGVPLGVHHTLYGSFARRESEAGFRRPALDTALPGERPGELADFDGRTEGELRLAWQYDTTDDPIFPFEGTAVVVALDYRTLEADLRPSETNSELLRLSVLARRHWPFARRHSFAAGLSVGIGRSEVEDLTLADRGVFDTSPDVWDVTATIRHTLRLEGAKKAPREGRLFDGGHREMHWQNDLTYSWSKTSPGFGFAFEPLEVASLRSAVILRTAWGLLSVGLRFVEVGDVL